MREKRVVTVANLSRRADEPRRNRIIPLRIFISAQNGRQYLIAYQPDFNCIKSFRLDYLSHVRIEEVTPRFDELRASLNDMEPYMWGVTTRRDRMGKDRLEHVSFTLRIEPGEEHILNRLQREKRVGRIQQLNDRTYRFEADVYDTGELLPWIRTFICRIEQMNFSNRTQENRFKEDLEAMYRLYGIGKEGS